MGWVCPPPPPPLLFFFRLRGGLWFSALSCRGFVVSAAACPGFGSLGLRPPSPIVWAAPLSFFFLFFFFARHFSSRVCVGPFRISSPPGGRCPRLDVAGFGRAVLRCSFGGPRGCRFRCCLAGGLACLLWSGCAASWLCVCLLPPPFFFAVCLFPFFSGGVCLFLPLPFLGWCTHWSAFGVANRVAVCACAWLGRSPVAWVGWVMYTLGLVAFPVRLGSGCARCFREVQG